MDLSTAAQTRALADFIRSTGPADLSADVVAESKRNILDFLGVAIGGAGQPAVRIVLGHIREVGGNPHATIPVFGDHTGTVNAALVLGIMGHVLDFDDTHLPTILHGTTPVMAAALPVAERLGATGAELIAAYAVGFEVAARIALALHPDHYAVGWHVTATAGAVGAAAAAANLLRLDQEQTLYALGMAATQAAGHREHFGTMSKSLGVGKAAANGTLAALLARDGYDAAADGLQGRRGMFAVMGGVAHPDRLDDGLGKRWELFNSGLKPYPCGIVTHPAIDAALRIRASYGPAAAEIAEVRMRVHPLVLELTNKQAPSTELEGKFSIGFTIAAALCRGQLLPSDFTAGVLDDPDVVRIRQLVRLAADESLTESEAYAVVRLTDGRELTAAVAVATGMPGNPMTDTFRHAKVHGLVDPVLGRAAAGALIERVDELDRAPGLDSLISTGVRKSA
jgi:2-methylcitrate dehydratase PrpD